MAEGKKPDVAEWAERFLFDAYQPNSADAIRQDIADFQRETLRWAAGEFMESPDSNWHGYEAAQLLERLAEGEDERRLRVEDKHE